MMRNIPIRRRLTLVVFGISVTVMLLMRGTFFTYEFLTFRETTLRHLSSLAQVLATNSTAALAFQNQDDAHEILTAVRAEQHIVAAAIYDRSGRLFAKYPDTLTEIDLPPKVGDPGYRFEGTNLAGFQPISEKGRLGALYLRFDMGEVMREWLWGSLRIALAVMGVVLVIAWLLSGWVQKQISDPILALARTAQVVSEQRD